ncbi:MAG: ABC transporter substrate-binding protein [bacterium]
MLNNWLLKFGYYLIIVSWLLVIPASASEPTYDGIWFLGFNLENEVFRDVRVRQAVNQIIKKDNIQEIVSAEAVPIGVIPPGMLGYDPELKPVEYSLKEARSLMKKAGLPLADERLKNITLLHTDGVKTRAIVERLTNDLSNAGIKVYALEMRYSATDEWAEELIDGDFDIFLMGFKADIEKLYTEEASTPTIDSYGLVEPLFGSSGEANFTGYRNADVDLLLYQLAGLNKVLTSERHEKLQEINDILYQDLPVIPLFYIEQL